MQLVSRIAETRANQLQVKVGASCLRNVVSSCVRTKVSRASAATLTQARRVSGVFFGYAPAETDSVILSWRSRWSSGNPRRMWSETDERYERLLAAMSDLAALLSTYGEDDWATWVRRASALVERGQTHGLDSMLSAFGGMGSLKDVVIHPRNGHAIEDDQISAVNEELGRLSSVVYSEASALRRELGRP